MKKTVEAKIFNEFKKETGLNYLKKHWVLESYVQQDLIFLGYPGMNCVDYLSPVSPCESLYLELLFSNISVDLI